jgi:hypothetical protein
MSLTNNHVLAGLPAWATHEEAEAAVAAMSDTEYMQALVAREAAERAAEDAEYHAKLASEKLARESWAMVSRYRWGVAYVATLKKDWPAAKAAIKSAIAADTALSPDNALLGAIMGLGQQVAPAAEVELGRGITAEQAAFAKRETKRKMKYWKGE